ncbi:8-oxo-dGTP pyrophosphatase MutT (NUDIX family) [Streptomyces spectabilis]|uniref:8-oxo-dGTP pyrophosphatase MutT (NUDIX family) n=1 Tax=Streptomyces spectabilis TaxID=68270 RepID=A0A7W8AUL6_STRST|nr:8-oxo-dGTP pyrophosphatase MutT (NUDIX family) [Streptomyces spectabilis]
MSDDGEKHGTDSHGARGPHTHETPDGARPHPPGGAQTHPAPGAPRARQPYAPRAQAVGASRAQGATAPRDTPGPAASAPQDHGRTPLTTEGLPSWLDPVVRAAATVRPDQLSRFLPPEGGGGRQSAVLVLFGEGERGPELLLMERAGSLRSHAGQPSFPGGSLDPEDGDPRGEGPLRAALREAEEETGLDPRGVQLFGVLPSLFIPVSDFVVTPVLGWWRAPSPVFAVDPAETARVFTVPVSDLTDPANRAMAVHPRGHQGPAFLVESALVWGFTAGVIDRILHFAGWERPWDRDRRVPLDWGS